MKRQDKISLFILELIKITKTGKTIWKESFYAPKLSDGNEKLVNLSYNTSLEAKEFRLYKYSVKHYIDEDEWNWSERIRLELVDNQGNSLYEFPYEYSLHDLYEAVREQTSGVLDFIDDILKS